MTQVIKPDTLSALQVFGKITANISHELKNALAVINEISGLLGDLAQAAERGRPLDPAMLVRLSDKVGGQVSRADAIIKRMNRFAHMVDHPFIIMNAGETLEFLNVLTERLINNRGLILEISAPEEDLPLETNAYGLMLLLFSCLEKCMQSAEKGETIQVDVFPGDQGGVKIGFSGMGGGVCFDETEKALMAPWLESLKAELRNPGEKHGIELTFPPSISQ